MFNLSGSEIVVILLLALVILGPEKLPDALRRAGRTYAELKKLGNNFQTEMKSVLDEPMKEMRETADLLQQSTKFEDHDPAQPGSGGRASPAPNRPAMTPSATVETTTPATEAPLEPVAAPSPEPVATDGPDDAEAQINRTLSGAADRPAGADDAT